MPPHVTIGLPCYNAAPFLAEALRSILAQTFTDWELIAVDDGSTDDTAAILAAVDDSRVRVLSDGANRGRCARLNQIAESATGEFLARMDADDVMFPERLARQVAFLRAHPEVDLLGAGLVSIDTHGAVRGAQCAPAAVVGARRILAGEVLYHPTVLGRTAWFRTHPYMPEYRYSDDFALWARHAGELRIANLPEPLLFYREHELFTYAKYRARSHETLDALRRFGPAVVAPATLRTLVLRRRLKDALYALLHRAGLWHHAHRLSRRAAIDAQTRQRYHAILSRLMSNAPLP